MVPLFCFITSSKLASLSFWSHNILVFSMTSSMSNIFVCRLHVVLRWVWFLCLCVLFYWSSVLLYLQSKHENDAQHKTKRRPGIAVQQLCFFLLFLLFFLGTSLPLLVGCVPGQAKPKIRLPRGESCQLSRGSKCYARCTKTAVISYL